ncbi:MAG: aminoacetone oxidase family FAD-binding enzyme, partial [Clostridia bacterium]|nr:aminoacetone oxidase family FAD-binding enzyme [Clostridia bacterium]
MAAITAAKAGGCVSLIEQNNMLGRKLLITGKGRCNVTNFCPEDELISQVVTNPKFLYSAFNAFNAYDAYAFFEEQGVPLKIERGNRVFPESDRAADVRDALKNAAQQAGVLFIKNKIVAICAEPLLVKGESGEYPCDAVILATGGCSYPLTGSTGDGYKIAKMLGHAIVEPQPSLVALEEEGKICCSLMGLSLKNVEISLFGCKGKELYREFGEMLFTHKGISGPIVLSASSYLKKSDFPCMAEIDLKPAMDADMLDKRLLRDFEAFTNKDFLNALDKLLPKKIIPMIIELSGIDPHCKVHQITKVQRERLVYIIKHFRIKLKGKADFSEAIITSGGINVREIEPR